MPVTRLVSPDDAAALAALLTDNREFLAPTDPYRADSYYSVAGQDELIEGLLAQHAAGTSLPHVILDDHGVLVGRITLNEIVRGPFQSCSVGYWVAEGATRRGLASAALASMTEIAFGELQLHRIQAGTLTDNAASRKVLTRNGFQRFGRAPAYLKIAGRWQDHILWQRLTPHDDSSVDV